MESGQQDYNSNSNGGNGGGMSTGGGGHMGGGNHMRPGIPQLLQVGILSDFHRNSKLAWMELLQEIMDVEHLWQYNAAELARLNQPAPPVSSAAIAANPLLSSAGISSESSPDLIANLCNIADHRLYKIVKWCKSLPLFKNISVIMKAS